MDDLLQNIRSCLLCKDVLPNAPKPVLSASSAAKILLVGQAPGRRVHESGIPWNDPSGDNLRSWLDMDKDSFYDSTKLAIVPMGFCYPGTGKSGDLPPPKVCAKTWHSPLLQSMPRLKLTVLIGLYAQHYYLGSRMAKNLTETVKNYQTYLPQYIVLPHPSPRNNIWQKKNPWFKEEIIPVLRQHVFEALYDGE